MFIFLDIEFKWFLIQNIFLATIRCTRNKINMYTHTTRCI